MSSNLTVSARYQTNMRLHGAFLFRQTPGNMPGVGALDAPRPKATRGRPMKSASRYTMNLKKLNIDKVAAATEADAGQ